MKIGILGGTGKEGSGLALRLARAGHQVVIGSRDEERARGKGAELAAASGGEVVGGSNLMRPRAERSSSSPSLSPDIALCSKS